jgi:hypothetical protein
MKFFIRKNFKIIFLIFFLSLTLFVNIIAQGNSEIRKLDISVGSGFSFNKIMSKQFILFFNIPKLKGNIGDLNFEEDFFNESISVNNNLTDVIGPATLLKYNVNVLNRELFFEAGIGLNYINNTVVATRNLGGHFIFSDMISIGLPVVVTKNFSIGINYLLRHISNAGLYKYNDGFTSQYIVLKINI